MLTKSSMAPAILLLILSACGDSTPSAPSRVQARPAQPSPPTQLLGQWNVTARLTEASGDKCAAQAVQSLVGAPKPYSILLTQTASLVEVTVTGTSGDYDCTFPATADSSGFTTVGVNGYYTCRTDFATSFRCSDGTQANLITLGQNVSGSIAGNEISGSWAIDWIDPATLAMSLTTTTEFTGRRQ